MSDTTGLDEGHSPDAPRMLAIDGDTVPVVYRFLAVDADGWRVGETSVAIYQREAPATAQRIKDALMTAGFPATVTVTYWPA